MVNRNGKIVAPQAKGFPTAGAAPGAPAYTQQINPGAQLAVGGEGGTNFNPYGASQFTASPMPALLYPPGGLNPTPPFLQVQGDQKATGEASAEGAKTEDEKKDTDAKTEDATETEAKAPEGETKEESKEETSAAAPAPEPEKNEEIATPVAKGEDMEEAEEAAEV